MSVKGQVALMGSGQVKCGVWCASVTWQSVVVNS